MKIPQEKSVAAIDVWEESFFQSEFTHASGVRKHVRYRGGFLAMWQSLAGQNAFPAEVPGEVAADTRGIREER